MSQFRQQRNLIASRFDSLGGHVGFLIPMQHRSARAQRGTFDHGAGQFGVGGMGRGGNRRCHGWLRWIASPTAYQTMGSKQTHGGGRTTSVCEESQKSETGEDLLG